MDILYSEGVVLADDLTFTETARRDGLLALVELDGIVYTRDSGMLETHKRLRVGYRRGAPYVSTAEYVYMALRRAEGRSQPLFRYDNSHGGVHTLHRHVFDDAGGAVGEVPVDPELMPYMDDVIRATAWLASYLASRE
jgi:hypothetical protein